MKKIILMMMALCAVAFVGCDKNDENGGGSLMINGVNFVGTWAKIEDHYDWMNDRKWQDGGRVNNIIVVTSDGYLNSYGSYDYDGYVFSDGYLYGCTMNDFEKDGGTKISVEKGGVYIVGILVDLEFEGNDIVTWYEGPYFGKYKRVKGFK